MDYYLTAFVLMCATLVYSYLAIGKVNQALLVLALAPILLDNVGVRFLVAACASLFLSITIVQVVKGVRG